MKAWNKRAYYATKYLIIGGILAAFPDDRRSPDDFAVRHAFS